MCSQSGLQATQVKNTETLDQNGCEHNQGVESFSQKMGAIKTYTTESDTNKILLEIKSVKLLLETLLAGQVCSCTAIHAIVTTAI